MSAYYTSAREAGLALAQYGDGRVSWPVAGAAMAAALQRMLRERVDMLAALQDMVAAVERVDTLLDPTHSLGPMPALVRARKTLDRVQGSVDTSRKPV